MDDIRIKIRGSHTEKVGKAYKLNILDSVKSIFQSSGRAMIFSLKILACIVVLAGVIFVYLVFTMEKGTLFINEIASSQTLIEEKKELIYKLEQEKQGLSDKRTGMKSQKDMGRAEKVAALDLEITIKKINDTIDQTKNEISVQEKKIIDNQNKLDAFRKKPFFKKLLKQ